jgi:hypothetical protein
MPRFHHLWIVEAELEIRNPAPAPDARCERLFDALAQYASDETEPYPSQVSSRDDGWMELTFPVWAPSQWAAVAAGSTVLAECCARCNVESGVVRLAAAESSSALSEYRNRTRRMEAAT